jgi:hypothetical protein
MEQKWKQEEEVAEGKRRQSQQGRRGWKICDIKKSAEGGGRNVRMRTDILTRPERTMARPRIIVARRGSGCKDFPRRRGL